MIISLAKFVWERAHQCCEYCHMPQVYDELPFEIDHIITEQHTHNRFRLLRTSSPFEIDHIIAEQHGGKTIASNLALACFADNHHKGPNLAGIDPGTRKREWLFGPRRQKWARHFRWDGPILVGCSSVGRTTIAVLGMNLAYRVRHRAQLIAEGVFPPEELCEST